MRSAEETLHPDVPAPSLTAIQTLTAIQNHSATLPASKLLKPEGRGENRWGTLAKLFG